MLRYLKQHVVEIVSRDKSFSVCASMDLAAEEMGKILVEEKEADDIIMKIRCVWEHNGRGERG